MYDSKMRGEIIMMAMNLQAPIEVGNFFDSVIILLWKPDPQRQNYYWEWVNVTIAPSYIDTMNTKQKSFLVTSLVSNYRIGKLPPISSKMRGIYICKSSYIIMLQCNDKYNLVQRESKLYEVSKLSGCVPF